MTTYKVIGSTAFQDHQPGDEFEAELDPFIEQWAKDNGYIEPVSKSKRKEKEASDG